MAKEVPWLRWALVLSAATWGVAAFCVAEAQTLRDAGDIGRFEFSVRAVSPAERPKDTSDEWMQFFVPGVTYGALGLVAPPMFASGLIVGGLLLAPSALIFSDMEHRTWHRATDALSAADFERDLLRAVKARAARALPEQAAPSGAGATALVELVVNAYGLAGEKPQQQVCFIASVDLVVSVAGQERLRDRLIIFPVDRSADAPPPQCASLDRMAARNGRLVRDTAAEYAEVLAAMAVDRLLRATRP